MGRPHGLGVVACSLPATRWRDLQHAHNRAIASRMLQRRLVAFVRRYSRGMSDHDPEQTPDWAVRAMEAMMRLQSLGRRGVQAVTVEVNREIEELGRSGTLKRSLRRFDRASGRFLRTASALEWTVATLIVQVAHGVPGSAPTLLGMTPSKRSEMLRGLLGDHRDWKRFVEEVEHIAILRNKLAHSSMRTFRISENGSTFEVGWFLEYTRLRKSTGEWYLREEEVTGKQLRLAARRAEFLEAVASGAILTMLVRVEHEEPGTPRSLRTVIESTRRLIPTDWDDELIEEIFPPDPDDEAVI